MVHVLVQPVHPVLVLRMGEDHEAGRRQPQSTQPRPDLGCGAGSGSGDWGGGGRLGAPTWGSPVRMLARLGEQLLAAVKAFWKRRLRRASASRAGVRMAELL